MTSIMELSIAQRIFNDAVGLRAARDEARQLAVRTESLGFGIRQFTFYDGSQLEFRGDGSLHVVGPDDATE